MRWKPWLATAVLVAACGQEGADPASAELEPAATESGNRSPEVERVEIAPAAPVVGDALNIASNAQDPDGDRIELTVEWFVNRQRQDETGLSFETEALQRGDEVYAIVRASDGELEGTAQTDPVRLGNSAPRVTALQLFPDDPDASQTLVAEASVEDRDGDTYELHFEWFVNGKRLEGTNEGTLEPGRVKRGDQLRVSVTARDEDSGPAFVSEPIVIANARPRIVSAPSQKIVGDDRYQYQISAEDPDGDRPLRYSLVRGPDGMNVDLVSGLVEWTVPPEADGKIEIEVAVRDAQGGESRQAYALEFRWESDSEKKSKPASSDDE
jgi:hypothetical protein